MVHQVSILLLALAGSVAFAKSINQGYASARVILITNNPVVGSPLQIDCVTEGSSDLQVTWQFAKSQLVADGRRMILPNNTIFITHAEAEDTGEYKCIARSQYSMATASVYVNVRHADNDAAMENTNLFEGDILGFEIDDDSNAVVEKQRLRPNGRFPYIIDPKLSYASARVILITNNPVVGSPLQIDCVTKGSSDLQVTWQFAKSQLVADGRRMIFPNNTLFITHAEADDTGEYKCIARSPPYSMATASVYVNVRHADNDAAMENPDLFEGDILGFEIDDDRNAVVEKHRVWPNGRIPYIIDPKLQLQVPKIEAAMQHYAEKTCIRFVPRTDEVQYVKIFPGKGCYSHVGKTLNDQPLSLGAGCFKFGTILHELGHAVGFYHEHSRSDRDDYLEIHRENIREGFENQFVKLRPKQNQLLTPFDFDSVMLYGETVFSKSHYDGLKTMTAKDGRALQDVVDKPGLSKSDIERITKLYKC